MSLSDKVRLKVEGEQTSSAMRNFVIDNLDKIEEIFKEEEILSIHVVCKIQKNGKQKVEFTLQTVEGLFRKEDSTDDFYDLLPVLVSDVQKLVLRHRDKVQSIRKKRRIKGKQELEKEILKEIENHKLKAKRISAEPLSEEMAILTLENISHSFFLYVDINSERPSLIYKKNDGGYGKLELY